jgi:hypothetical protein
MIDISDFNLYHEDFPIQGENEGYELYYAENTEKYPIFASKTYNPIEPISIANESQLIIKKNEYNWSGTGISEDPIIIQGYNFTQSKYPVLLLLQNLTSYIRIQDNIFGEGIYGIEIQNVSNIQIIENRFQNIITTGIQAKSLANLQICNNFFNIKGICINLQSCVDPLIENNTINNQFGYAIIVGAGCIRANINNNSFFSVYEGIATYEASINVTITRNILLPSARAAIVIGNPSSLTVEYNTLVNGCIAFYVEKYNSIYSMRIRYNNFIFRLYEPPIQGAPLEVIIAQNFYSDLVQPDLNEDGFIDQPFYYYIYNQITKTHDKILVDPYPRSDLYPEHRITLIIPPKFPDSLPNNIYANFVSLEINWTRCITNLNYRIVYNLSIISNHFQIEIPLWSGENQTNYIWNLQNIDNFWMYYFKLTTTIITPESKIYYQYNIISQLPIGINNLKSNIISVNIPFILFNHLNIEWTPITDGFNQSYTYTVYLIKALDIDENKIQTMGLNQFLNTYQYYELLSNSTTPILEKDISGYSSGLYTILISANYFELIYIYYTQLVFKTTIVQMILFSLIIPIITITIIRILNHKIKKIAHINRTAILD